MKKTILFLLTIVSLFLAASCTTDYIPEGGKTYLDYVIEDYDALVAQYPDAKDHFVEAQFVLDNVIADTPAADIKAKTLTIICYMWKAGYSDIFVHERNFETGETDMFNYQADSPWLGDSQISDTDLRGLKVSLEKALESAKKEAGSGDGLNTVNVTLRKPVYPFWPNAQYVIGGSAGRHDHVFVDAVEGTVDIREGAIPEGSAESFLSEDFGVIADTYDGGARLGYQLDVKRNMVEVQYVLNSNVNAAQVSELEPVMATYIFYIPAMDGHPAYRLQAVRNSFKMGTELEFSEEVVSAPWSDVRYIDVMRIDDLIGLTDAVHAVKLGNVTDPDGNLVTLCNDGTMDHVFHFKGNAKPDVYVDAFTGEIVK